MKVSFLALTEEHKKYQDEFESVFNTLLNRSDYIQGKYVKSFESELIKSFQPQFVQSCANGTDAILLSLMALGLNKGDEVLVPSFTYAATAGPVAILGLKPVFVDVDPRNFTIDINDLMRKISAYSKAIIPVHLFGQACDMSSITEIAKDYNLTIIEDNAQSLGTEWLNVNDGTKYFSGTIGNFGTNSFFPSKNLGGLGDAGAVFCKTEENYYALKSIAAHGQNGKYNHERLGLNSRLDTLQAGFLLTKLKFFSDSIQARKMNAFLYAEHLKDCTSIELPHVPDYSIHSYNQFSIKVKGEKRDSLKNYLKENGIDTMVYYPKPLHQQKAFKSYSNNCPVSEKLANELLSIPIHPMLKNDELDYVSSKIREFFK